MKEDKLLELARRIKRDRVERYYIPDKLEEVMKLWK